MEIEVQQLIDKIKKDGLHVAQQQTETALREAREKADRIVSDAEQSATETRRLAQAEADKFQKSAKEAIKQALRDAVLSLRQDVEKMFSSILKEDVDAQLQKEDVVSQVILEALKNITKSGDDEAAKVVLPSDSSKKLEEILRAQFTEKAKSKVTIAKSESLPSGFAISQKDGYVYYDFTDSQIASLLFSSISEDIKQILGELEF